MSLLPDSPDITRFAGIDLYVNSLTIGQAAGSVGIRNLNGSLSSGSGRRVITGATVLTAADSGALCVWNAAAGYLFTLPAPVAGLTFDFFVGVTITSVGAKVITKTITTDFIAGHVFSGLAATTPGANPGPKFFVADGTANAVAINMYGATSDTTSGGVIGSAFRLTAISTTQWAILNCGIIATGTIVTPVAAS